VWLVDDVLSSSFKDDAQMHVSLAHLMQYNAWLANNGQTLSQFIQHASPRSHKLYSTVASYV